MYFNLISAGFVLAISGLCLSLDDIDPVVLEEKITNYVTSGLGCHNNPGLSLSVVKDSKVLLAKGFGHRALDKLEPVTNETLFGIASLSKAFAATLLLKQIEENDS